MPARSRTAAVAEPVRTLELVAASKSFGGVPAIEGVDLKLEEQTVHVLVGENGAGKSTIVKVLSGIHQLSEGQINLNGRPVTFNAPRDAIRRGIVTIHQELMLVPDLTVAENIFLGKEPLTAARFVDKKTMRRKAQEVLAHLKQDFSPDARVRGLGIAQQQMVEIARALMNNCRVLILDEPTAAITDKETGILFDTIRGLKNAGVAILYISHRLEELFEIGDRTTILRNGRKVFTGPTATQTIDGMIHHMIGRELGAEYPALPPAGEAVALTARDVAVPGKLRDVSIELCQGEILGFYGLIGAGRTELMRTLFGLEVMSAGTIEITGRGAAPGSPREAIARGVGMIPEDRKKQGLLLQRSVRENISLASLGALSRFGFTRKGAEIALVDGYIRDLAIKTERRETRVLHLSGGNQQKVVISKVLSTRPDIVIFDEPTRGIDVGAKQEVYRAMLELIGWGKSILMVSSDIREVLGMSHRIVVMCNGTVTAQLAREDATQERILFHAFPRADASARADGLRAEIQRGARH
ncbi:sugar ABC transporter ATP-binding protein [Ancylobacter sp. VNQ12]|uniref:sugar ABC transporter ATP-binding protein n=1 Tax=Ancylobacter sp. VNQ12 TaxID=3400920 RepID=UPI003BFBFB78